MVLASMFKSAAESEVLWDKFLPPDYQEILSKSVCPMTYKSKKELFYKLSSPLLIDGGLKVNNITISYGFSIFVFVVQGRLWFTYVYDCASELLESPIFIVGVFN